jgi:DNA-directed RNA polymerase specialized sigma subunit
MKTMFGLAGVVAAWRAVPINNKPRPQRYLSDFIKVGIIGFVELFERYNTLNDY